jgi:ribosomal subunit interface protein
VAQRFAYVIAIGKKGLSHMSLRISGKHMDIGDALRGRIETRINDAVEKYFDGGFSGHVVVERAGSRFTADCVLHLDSGMSLQAAGQGQEAPAAFDGAADRIEKRLRRYKRKLKSHTAGGGNGVVVEDIAYTVMEAIPDEGDEEVEEDFAPAVVAESTVSLRTMSVANAVVELDIKDSPVVVFRNAGNNHVNVVYRRADGNIGWVDSGSAAKR